MSYKTDRYNVNKLSGQSLAVTQCGIQICDPGHSYGPHVYCTYAAHFIIEGKGVYTVNGKSYELEKGQGFMIIPGISNTYTADEKEPWKYIYACFSGADDDSLVLNAGLDEENVIFDFPLDEKMLSDLYSMHNTSKSYDALGYDVTAYFLLVMSRLIRENSAKKTAAEHPEQYVKKAMLFVENNYNRAISLSDITSFVGIERTYLYKLFKKYVGQAPSQYINNLRLEKAVRMMENENVSINEIAYSTGFYDVPHFYKAFGAKYGISPKKFRESEYEKKV